MAIYLIKRVRPNYHKTPFHPIIICGKKKIAKWEAGDTNSKAWVWEHNTPSNCSLNSWLLTRWNGLDIDYGYVIKDVGPLPDGTHTGFFHDRDKEPWILIAGAIWWDNQKMPRVLQDMGVIYPPDKFTQQRILDDIAEDGLSGFGRKIPAYWPVVGRHLGSL